MANLTKIVLPVKSGDTIQPVTYDLPGTATPEGLGFGYGTCSTAEATVAKTVDVTGFTLTKNSFVSITFTNAVPSSATLNVNSTGAKAVYHKGSAITSGKILAGDTATFVFDGTHFNLIAVDRIPTSSGNTLTL